MRDVKVTMCCSCGEFYQKVQLLFELGKKVNNVVIPGASATAGFKSRCILVIIKSKFGVIFTRPIIWLLLSK